MSYKDKCPDFEQLSAWYDGVKDPEVESHLNECDKCRAVVEDFGAIKTATKISVPVPKDLERAILERVQSDDGAPVSEKSGNSAVWWLVVGGLVILIAILLRQYLS